MADAEYRRLGCAVEACAGEHKAHGYCLRHYRQMQRGGITQDATACVHCGAPMLGKMAGSIYCGASCKGQAWKKANPERLPTLCAYWTGFCTVCGAAMGAKRERHRCDGCRRAAELEAARESTNALNAAKHKSNGLVVHCSNCETAFCPLYGTKIRRICPCCEPVVRKEQERAVKARRDKRIRSTTKETVLPSVVFKRDGWRCQLCGIETPRRLRGSCHHNAPELDHVVPLSRGGEHTYANTQCTCRSCNGWKGARTMTEAIQALAS